MKKALMMAAIAAVCLSTSAKVTPILHYNFGKAGNVTYAIAPEQINPVSGKGTLKVMGTPVFYADAPDDRKLRGEGGILFNGKTDGYRLPQASGTPNGNQLMEVWVKSRTANTHGQTQVVVANGNGKSGYTIAQKNDRWILIAGGTGITEIGEVAKDVWVHLAMVIDGGKGSVWMNGKRIRGFGLTKELASNFSIAIADNGGEAFSGEVHEVRLSTFKDGAFSKDTDFLIDYKQLKRQDRMQSERQKALIAQLQTAGMGKELVSQLSDERPGSDWLISKVNAPCRLQVLKTSKDAMATQMRLSNGLVTRTFYVGENLACTGYKNLSNGAEYLRAVKPEARIMIDSVWYEVGGLKKQPEYSYLLESWLPQMEASDRAFRLAKVETGMPIERYPWKPKYNATPTDWPAKGLRVVMTYEPTASMPDVKDVEVRVNYEIYQGIPVMTKWIEVVCQGDRQRILDEVETEIVAMNQDQIGRIHVESDYSFALANADVRGSALMHYNGTPKKYHVGSSTTQWRVDADYNTWASHNQAEDKFLGFQHHNLLVSTLPMGPSVVLDNKHPFTSYITFELLQDSDDRERQSLGHRRMYKILAPQVTESLIAGGITSHDEKKLKAFIDQMAELGLEQLDIMAWPGISHDNLKPEYVSLWQRVASYAKERGIVMGGYELQIASRGRGEKVDCVNPETGKPGSLFGQSVCIASQWKDDYYAKMWEFFDKTGFMTYNMDGPYHGDVCAATNHAHHRGLEDSQWEQWKTQVDIIHQLKQKGMYVPIPDWYFLNGQNSTGMGYREASANLTPQQQLLLGRQYIYDGTWHKLPPMGWMTLQLVGFYTNDPRVGLEPLCDNLDRYEQQLIQYLASGCHLTIRGNRLYDTPETKQMVEKWLKWFKQYRDILTSDIIHVSRPNGRDIDCIMHVNPYILHKGMVVVFNPTDNAVEKNLKLPLYYTGLKGKATITTADGKKSTFTLDGDQSLTLPVSVKAQGTTWLLIE